MSDNTTDTEQDGVKITPNMFKIPSTVGIEAFNDTISPIIEDQSNAPSQQTLPTPKLSPLDLSKMNYTGPAVTAPVQDNYQDKVVPSAVDQIPDLNITEKPQAPITVSKTAKQITLPPEWKPEDVQKVDKIAEKHGLAPNELWAIFQQETGNFDPKTRNTKSDATGLIQFLPSTAAEMLLKKKQMNALMEANVKSTAEVESKGLTGDEAEKVHKKYFQEARKENPNYAELSKDQKQKASNWAQKAIASMSVSDQLDLTSDYLEHHTKGKKGLDAVYSAVFGGKPNKGTINSGTKAYNDNKGYDKDNDGKITREEFLSPVRERASNIAKVTTVPPPQIIAEAEPLPNKMPKVDYTKSEIEPSQREEIMREAFRLYSLANPGISPNDVAKHMQNIPVNFVQPGTEEGEKHKEKSAAGLYWPGAQDGTNKRIGISTAIPPSSAPGVLAHEIGHSYGKDEGSIPGEIASGEGFHFQKSVDAPFQAALNEGKRKIDEEQAARINELQWLPDWLKQRIFNKPSDSVRPEVAVQQAESDPYRETGDWQVVDKK